MLPLEKKELNLLKEVFIKNKRVKQVILFGSRAKGTAKNNSDIDLAVSGLGDELDVENLAMELDDLPLPYKFDLKALSAICNPSLRKHIQRVGFVIYDIVPT